MPEEIKPDEKLGDFAGKMITALVEGMRDQIQSLDAGLTIIDYVARDDSMAFEARCERIRKLVADLRSTKRKGPSL